jgi:plastocyanin
MYCPPKSSVRSATVLLAASLLLIACSGGATPPSSAQQEAAASSKARDTRDTLSKVSTVIINQFKYLPDTLTVNAGDVVEWKNDDIVPHTATAVDKKAFDSGRIVKGSSWRFTANTKGTFDYLCTLHPNMKAKLIVQ